MIDKQMQRNSLGIVGLGAFCGSIMQAATGDFENAIILGAIAPSLFAIRSDIPSLEMRRDIDDRENAIYQSMEYNVREDDTRMTDMDRDIHSRIDSVERQMENEVREIYSEMSNNTVDITN
tara:strand:+ start:854 stop:1216 length:363 start_codon:yes stop_codon:yes gene_type:complete